MTYRPKPGEPGYLSPEDREFEKKMGWDDPDNVVILDGDDDPLDLTNDEYEQIAGKMQREKNERDRVG